MDNEEKNNYFEGFSKRKHRCPNRQQGKKSNFVTQMTTDKTKPTHYSKKSYSTTQSKQKMSSSLELLSGPIAEIQKKYEILSDIVMEYNGKVQGSQPNVIQDNSISLIVYYEVPEGKKKKVKKRFNNYFVYT